MEDNQSRGKHTHEQQLDTTPRSKEGNKEVEKTHVVYTKRKRDDHPPVIVPNSPSHGQSSTSKKGMENCSHSNLEAFMKRILLCLLYRITHEYI